MENKFIVILCCFIFNANAQNDKTSFGLQYKPIIASEYFNSSNIESNFGNFEFKLSPKYSNAFGMIIRHQIHKLFSIESGLNYTQRNFELEMEYNYYSSIYADITTFNIRSYELPIQLLTYIQVSNSWYLNVAFGVSHNVLASDALSFGKKNNNYYQNTYRKNGGYKALLANIGMEYRTPKKGYYYFGASLHRPFKAIAKIYPEFEADNDPLFVPTDDKLIDLLGNFVTIDFRYFFPN